MTYLRFVKLPNEGKKTDVYMIYNSTSGNFLGKLLWRFGWRQYVYRYKDIDHSRSCLRELASFLDELMEERKKKKSVLGK